MLLSKSFFQEIRPHKSLAIVNLPAENPKKTSKK